MRIGIISDIHNNDIALEAVLQRLNGCDRIICCGDIIGIGPHPEQTVQRLRQIPNLTAVRGNHERYLLEPVPEDIPEGGELTEAEIRHHQWEHSCLTVGSIAFLHGLPYRETLELAGKTLAIQHYAMDVDYNYVNPTGSAELFLNLEADVILYGHDHAPHCAERDGKWYINPGALGCPGQTKNIARAGILTIEQGELAYEALEIPYDVEAVLAEIDRLQYPDAETIKKIFFDVE